MKKIVSTIAFPTSYQYSQVLCNLAGESRYCSCPIQTWLMKTKANTLQAAYIPAYVQLLQLDALPVSIDRDMSWSQSRKLMKGKYIQDRAFSASGHSWCPTTKREATGKYKMRQPCTMRRSKWIGNPTMRMYHLSMHLDIVCPCSNHTQLCVLLRGRK
jgi:hypothetical protein